jgi:hypothetical protein
MVDIPAFVLIDLEIFLTDILADLKFFARISDTVFNGIICKSIHGTCQPQSGYYNRTQCNNNLLHLFLPVSEYQ